MEIKKFGFYFLLDDLSLMHTLYLTVVLLATVGFGDISPLDNMPADGNLYLILSFTILLIAFGISAFLYAIGIVTEYIVSGEIVASRRQRRMQNRIGKLNQHHIICGAGETGVYAAEELEKTGRDFVIIDSSRERVWEIEKSFNNLHYILGDATDEGGRVAG